MNLDQLLDAYYSARYIEEGEERSLAQGVFDMAKAHEDIQALISAERTKTIAEVEALLVDEMPEETHQPRYYAGRNDLRRELRRSLERMKTE